MGPWRCNLSGHTRIPVMIRLRALDGLRGFAILWVLSYHLVALPARAASLRGFPALMVFAQHGWIGVNLFFVLSGYLITQVHADQPRDRYYFGNFWIRRFFRILPAYALLLLSFPLARALWPVSAPGGDNVFNLMIPFWSYLAFSQNFYMASISYLGNDWMRVLWSLAVEVQFYLFICLALFFIPRRQTMRWFAVLAAASVVFRFVTYLTQANADTALVVLLPSRLDSFLLGGLVALLPRVGVGVLRPSVAVVLVVLAGLFLRYYSSGRFGAMMRFAVPFYYTVISVGSIALLDLCVGRFRPLAWLMESWPLVEAGRLSYFIYLFHMPVALTVFHFVQGTPPVLGTPTAALLMVGAFAVVCLAARLSYTFFEAPLIRYSHSLVRRPAPVVTKPACLPDVTQ